MDLDVVHAVDGRGIWIDDRDEWDEHRVAYGYPLEIVEQLESLAIDLEKLVRAGVAPFDDATPDAWLDRLAALRTRTEQGRRRMNVEHNRADLDKDPARVSGMFDQVAEGLRPHQHRAEHRQRPHVARRHHARRRPAKRAERSSTSPPARASSSVALARSGAQVVAADFSPGMIAEGERRHGAIRRNL